MAMPNDLRASKPNVPIAVQVVGSDPQALEKFSIDDHGNLVVAVPVVTVTDVPDMLIATPPLIQQEAEVVTIAKNVSSFELVPHGNGYDLHWTTQQGVSGARFASDLRQYLLNNAQCHAWFCGLGTFSWYVE